MAPWSCWVRPMLAALSVLSGARFRCSKAVVVGHAGRLAVDQVAHSSGRLMAMG